MRVMLRPPRSDSEYAESTPVSAAPCRCDSLAGGPGRPRTRAAAARTDCPRLGISDCAWHTTAPRRQTPTPCVRDVNAVVVRAGLAIRCDPSATSGATYHRGRGCWMPPRRPRPRHLLAVATSWRSRFLRQRIRRASAPPAARHSCHAARFSSFACFSSSAGAGTKPSCCRPAALNPLATR